VPEQAPSRIGQRMLPGGARPEPGHVEAAFQVLQLAYIKVRSILLAPPQEDVGCRVYPTLAVYHPLAVIGESCGADIWREHRRSGFLDLQD